MKVITIKKRINPKYMPSHKYEIHGYHEDGTGWFASTYRTKKEALAHVDYLRKPFDVGGRIQKLEIEIEMEG